MCAERELLNNHANDSNSLKSFLFIYLFFDNIQSPIISLNKTGDSN